MTEQTLNIIGTISFLLMILSIVLSLREGVILSKGIIPSKVLYRTQVITLMLIVPMEIIQTNWLNTVIWSFCLILIIRRLNKSSLDIWN